MNPNCSADSAKDGSKPLPESGPSRVVLVLRHYLPPTRNQLKGTHWSVLHRERNRAAIALKFTLESMPSDQQIGMGIISRSCKMCLDTLAFWMAIHGMYCAEESLPKRFTRKQKKEQKS